MKELHITPATFIRDPAHRHFLGRVAVYAFVLYLVIPLATGLILPHVAGYTKEPSADLFGRIIALIATGGVCVLIMMAPALVLVRYRWPCRVHVFVLLPVAMISLATQIIMYLEFGTAVDTRVFGLMQGNFGALWTYAARQYHIPWLLLFILALSAGFTWLLCRPRDCGWSPGIRSVAGSLAGVAVAGAVASGMNLSPTQADHYHPNKVAHSPLYQIVHFFGEYLLVGHASGYRGIMEKAEAFEGNTYKQLTRRLGAEPELFAKRVVRRPSWLKRQPSHVFLFVMESVDYSLIAEEKLQVLAPSLTRFAQEGLSVPHFTCSSNLTIDSIHSAVGGVSKLVHYPVPRALKHFPLDALTDIMRRADHRPIFYAASRREFGDKGDVCEAYGYDFFKGAPDVAPQIKANEWGVNDGDFYQWVFDELQPMEGPLFVTLLNVSNHSPHDAPLHELGEVEIPDEVLARMRGRDRKDKLKYAKHILYADVKMGEMAERLKQSYPDALFVFVGDHVSIRMETELLRRVPFVLWNDRVIDPDADASQWYGSHMDIPATLAQLVLKDGDTFSSLGEPVWSTQAGRVTSCGPDAITRQGYLSDDGTWLKKFQAAANPHDEELTPKQILLRKSAIDALSWGYIHGEPLPPKP